ncbi:MAG: tripartite tricarboxylate transporter substrate binding protein [Comamonas sp.]
MNPITRRQALAFGAGTLAAAMAPAAFAQAYDPSRPIRVIVPFPPGTGLDVDSRFFTARLSSVLGQTFVIENKPGAAGTIGTDYAAKQPADGYTLYMGSTSALAYIPELYTKLNYKLSDFTAVSQLALLQGAMIANPQLPVRNAAELVALSRARPGTIRAATQGVGSFAHMVGEWFVMATGASIEFIPYNTSSPFASVLAGDTQLIFDALPASMSNIQAGKLKALAVTGAQRQPLVPEVPTYREQGIADFEPCTWFGLMAPARTPAAIIRRIADACRQVAQLPDAIERYQSLGGEPVGNTPEAFAAFIQSEQDKWIPVVRRTGIRLD